MEIWHFFLLITSELQLTSFERKKYAKNELNISSYGKVINVNIFYH